MKYYLETISRRSDKPGPIDPATGWPSVSRNFVVEVDSLNEAYEYFKKKYPKDVLIVYEAPGVWPDAG